jgi:hypothetical protein
MSQLIRTPVQLCVRHLLVLKRDGNRARITFDLRFE